MSKDMNSTNLDALPPALLALVPDVATSELGPGVPNHDVETELSSLDLDRAFSPHEIVDREMAEACHSGLWLGHNFLDASHTLSQSNYSTTGSFWHGIMHRREGEFSNAKHWFRKAGDHPVFVPLNSSVRELAEELGTCPQSEFLRTQTTWDPMAFIDLCEQVSQGGEDHTLLCGRVARQEWELLMQYSFQQAVNS